MADNAGPYIQKVAEWFSSHNVLYNNYWQTDAASYPGDLKHYPTASAAFHDAFGPQSTLIPPTPDPAPPTAAPAPAPVSNAIDRWLIGDEGNNTLTGGDGHDYLNGSAGDDVLTGRGGDDIYVVDTSRDQIVEVSGGGFDRVDSWAGSYTLSIAVENLTLVGSYTQTGTGNELANRITGGSGANLLHGQGGDDVLNGKAGSDTLTGGSGKDTFVFDTGPNNEVITDFNVADDSIHLDHGIFQSFGDGSEAQPGQIAEGMFCVGNKARDANDHLIYNKDNGVLYYDADGTGASGQIAIVTLATNLKMTYRDFFIV
jgi:Ca2+-binding RTX toxin-like protein